MAKTMMPLLKRAGRCSYRGCETGGGGSGGKTKPVKLPETIRASRASTKQSARSTILNKTRIKVENDPTTRVNNLTTRYELHGKSRNMSDRGNMKEEVLRVPRLATGRGVPSAVRTRTCDSTG